MERGESVRKKGRGRKSKKERNKEWRNREEGKGRRVMKAPK